jgi:eukaryotic-like serine/threonine-protein kinase
LKRVGDGALSDSRQLRRFEREAELLMELEHPSIVRVYGLEVIDGVPLLVMEWVDGPDLVEWSRGGARERPSVTQRLELFAELCDALHFAHQRGVIHRDIKPSNVLVDDDGRPRLLDFGLARRSSTGFDDTLTIGFAGTPAYSPPEAFADTATVPDARGDVWSLGVVLFELLTDRRPFAGESFASLAIEITRSEPERPSRLDPRLGADLDAITLHALAKDVAERYDSVAHFADDVRRFLAGEPVAARPRRIGYVVGKWVRRRRLVACSRSSRCRPSAGWPSESSNHGAPRSNAIASSPNSAARLWRSRRRRPRGKKQRRRATRARRPSGRPMSRSARRNACRPSTPTTSSSRSSMSRRNATGCSRGSA